MLIRLSFAGLGAAWRRRLCALLGLGMAALLCGGCGLSARRVEKETPSTLGASRAGQPLKSAQLDELTRAFADRYVGLLSCACDALKKDNPSVVQCREAQDLLVNCATNIYDIASNPDPFTRMLDMVVVTTLVSQVWIDDDRAGEVFEGRDDVLVRALHRGRVEVWAMAAKVLKADQLDLLDNLLWNWRRHNPEMIQPYFVRFSKFAIERGDSTDSEVVAASGLFASVGQASQEIEETRKLTERMFYLLKREPLLLHWRAEALQDAMLANPEVVRTLADVHRLSDQAGQLPQIIATERTAVLSAYDARKPGLDETLTKVSGVLTDAKGLAASLDQVTQSLNDMLKTVNALAGRFEKSGQSPGAAPSRPFDMREYTEAIKELAVAAVKMDALIKSSHELLGSSEWDRRIQTVNQSVDGRMKMAAEQSRQLVDAIFLRVYAAIGVLFGMLVLWLVIALQLRRRFRRAARDGAGDRGAD